MTNDTIQLLPGKLYRPRCPSPHWKHGSKSEFSSGFIRKDEILLFVKYGQGSVYEWAVCLYKDELVEVLANDLMKAK